MTDKRIYVTVELDYSTGGDMDTEKMTREIRKSISIKNNYPCGGSYYLQDYSLLSAFDDKGKRIF